MPISVLIAEDNTDLKDIWESAFHNAEGFTIRSATDGTQALTYLNEALPQVLVTDYHMPEMNGIELVTNLRDMPDGDAVRVIMVTADDSVRFHQGADRVDIFLHKPIFYEDLVQFAKRLRKMVK